MGRALITGITGQDGSYLAEFLLARGYQVYGLLRRHSSPNTSRIAHILGQVTLLDGDLSDPGSLVHALKVAKPDEVYNLAAQSHVGTSFKMPVYTTHINALGALRLLEAIKLVNSDIKFYQASTSEMFGNAPESPQNERTPFLPVSPYGTAKLFAHHTVGNYRANYGMFCCSGILFNHESPRRGLDFVTRKITRGLASIYHGSREKIKLGNIHTWRDWGFAGDYVEAMWLMLQHNEPDDYVIATGETYSIRQFIHEASPYANINDWTQWIDYDQDLTRPTDITTLVGDASKARRVLGWQPRTSFRQLVAMMIRNDMGEYHENQSRAHSSSSIVGHSGRVGV